MKISLPLERMSVADKLRTMEFLWDDLCKRSDDLISPSWHEDVLVERDLRVAEGKESTYDWNEAKKRIRRSGK
jgi:hypothetical protein